MKKLSLFVIALMLLALSGCKVASIQELKVSPNITLKLGDTIQIGRSAASLGYVYIKKKRSNSPYPTYASVEDLSFGGKFIIKNDYPHIYLNSFL